MKILWTGYTANQCGVLTRSPIDIANFPKAIIETMRRLGHTVEWKIVPFDEDPTRYDLVIINAAPCNSFMGRYGALQTARLAFDAHANRVPTVIYFDDWQVHNFFSNAKVLVVHPDKILRMEPGNKRLFFFTAKEDEIKRHRDKILAGFKLLITPRYDRFAVLLSKHHWGKLSKAIARIPVATEANTTYLDPTPIIPDWSHRPVVDFEKKRRAWVLPALIPHDKWVTKQDLSWPIDLFGCRKLDAPRLKTEREIIDEVALRWGSLAPEYPHAGSGWFRSRYLYAAWGRTIMLCSSDDAWALGEPFVLVRDSKYQIEKVWDDSKRRELAEAQAKVIEALIPSLARCVVDIEKMFALAKERAHA